MKIFVGNLSYEANDEDLRATFTPFGTLASAQVIMDRETGRSRGFGFVEMSNDTEGQAAINALNGKDLKGRAMTVNQARPREESRGGGRRPMGGGGGGGGGRW